MLNKPYPPPLEPAHPEPLRPNRTDRCFAIGMVTFFSILFGLCLSAMYYEPRSVFLPFGAIIAYLGSTFFAPIAFHSSRDE